MSWLFLSVHFWLLLIFIQVISQLKVLGRSAAAGCKFDREIWSNELSPVLNLWKKLNQVSAGVVLQLLPRFPPYPFFFFFFPSFTPRLSLGQTLHFPFLCTGVREGGGQTSLRGRVAGVTVMPAVVPARLHLLRVPVITACRLSARSVKSTTARQSGIFHRTQGAEGAPLVGWKLVWFCTVE